MNVPTNLYPPLGRRKAITISLGPVRLIAGISAGHLLLAVALGGAS